jgi:LysM repeat protein
MFVRLLVVAALAVGLWALFVRDSDASGRAQPYRVKAGDTLWSIAAAHLAGDPRKGVWELQQKNHLAGTTITPGQILRIP